MASEIRVTDIKANDGTSSLTVANSTGNVSVGGALTASGGIANAGTISAGTLGSSVNLPSFVGMVTAFAMSSPPTGWLACDGSAVSRSTYSSLFSAIGTTWGAGDGSSTFNVPDLRGAFLRGTGSHGSSTMAGGGAFAGPSVGSYENDSFQDHEHTQTGQAGNAGPYANGTYPGTPATTNVVAGDEETPRNSDGETKPFNAGVNYCIKT